MVKRKVNTKKSKGIKRIHFRRDSLFLNEKLKLNNKKGIKKFKELCDKEERKRERVSSYSSSSVSSLSSIRVDPPRKKRKVSYNKKGHNNKFKPKRRYNRRRNVQKEKILTQKKILQTCYKNPSFCGSCESLEANSCDSRKLRHIELPRSSSFKCVPTEYPTQRLKSSCSLQLEKEGSVNINDLDGVTFVTKSDPDGSSTEISFQSTLLMCVRKTAATEDLRSESTKSVQRIMDPSQLSSILSEVSAGSRGLYKCDSSHLLKVAVHNNHSKSRANLLRLKSSQNFTDLDFQRVSQSRINNSATVISHSHRSLQEILSPRSIRHSEVNSFLNSTPAVRNSQNTIGDHDLFDGMMSYDQLHKRSVAGQISQGQISLLHPSRSQHQSALLLACDSARRLSHQLHSQTSTVQVQAVVHMDAEHM